jgi:DNA repair protein RadC
VVKDLAPHDRPREKLARAGVASLGDNELVAVLLGSGVRERSALTVAQAVLDLAGGVRGLTRIDVQELQRVPGVGAPRAARLLAAIELGRRAISGDLGDRPRLVTSAALAAYLMPLYGGHNVERMGVLLLDARNRVIRSEIVSHGTLDACIGHPRDVFRAAAVGGAASIVVFHNHPSGDPRPSPADRALTRRLAIASEVMGIRIADHIILGDGLWFSFRDANEL